MKKKLMECKIHGISLHRVKRRCWKGAQGVYASSLSQNCFNCIEEKNIESRIIISKPRKEHISLK